MKLNSQLVERTLSQIPAAVIPDDHPMLPALKGLFGDHTFFVDASGLSIVERREEKPRTGEMVTLANWDEGDPSRLVCHMPDSTDLVIEFKAMN
jgi:hypothetical protein